MDNPNLSTDGIAHHTQRWVGNQWCQGFHNFRSFSTKILHCLLLLQLLTNFEPLNRIKIGKQIAEISCTNFAELTYNHANNIRPFAIHSCHTNNNCSQALTCMRRRTEVNCTRVYYNESHSHSDTTGIHQQTWCKVANSCFLAGKN